MNIERISKEEMEAIGFKEILGQQVKLTRLTSDLSLMIIFGIDMYTYVLDNEDRIINYEYMLEIESNHKLSLAVKRLVDDELLRLNTYK